MSPTTAVAADQVVAGRYSILHQIGMLSQDENWASPLVLAILLVLPLLLFFLKKLLFPTVDVREPPVLRPSLPFFGHIISMVKERSSWYKRLNDESSLPVCTLPMLHGKMYVINSPDLVISAMRNIDVSFDPFLIEFSAGMLGLSDKLVKIIEKKHVMDGLMHIIHTSLMGEPLYKMNVVALTNLMKTLNGIGPDSMIAVSDSWTWTQELMAVATMEALFGEKNPYKAEHVHLIGEFEQGVSILALGYAPTLLAPGPLKARNELNKILKPFYVAGHETRPDVSAIIQRRAELLRREGFDDDDLGVQEITLPWVGTTNTIPTLFWLFVHLFSRPEYVKRVRAEIESIATINIGDEGRVATLKAKEVDKQCPVLMACYREVLRMYIHNVGNRRTMKDTTIKDSNGREYLLKKGINVQWSSSVTHTVNSVWGDDAAIFKPERFLDVTAQEEKRRRGANIPFGGGRNLCPGRNFALAENLGFIGVLAAGFEVDGVHVPESEDPIIGTGARKPVWGSTVRSARIRRRSGWQDVTWRFAE
ncbi:Fc.00g115310.m01.CDS01 [Cosmosporella sp. VM-42]